jgi:hypothetical protein
VQDALKEKLGAVESESGNAEVQWNDIKICVLDAMSDLRRTRKPLIAQEIISKMHERGKWKNINNEERRKEKRKNYRILKKEFKRTTEKAKKE